MCYMCEAYGEGKLWYLNPKNFARQLYKIKRPDEKPQAYGTDPESQQGERLSRVVAAKWEQPDRFPQLLKEVNEAPREGGCQVLPLRDAWKVAEMAYPITSMMCICRKNIRGDEERNPEEYTCTGLGPGMFKWERWPERYKGGVNFMNQEEARAWLTKMDKKGFVHMIMTFGGSYVGGICNCDYPDCGPIRQRLDYGIEPVLMKSHYVAKVSYDLCNGCGVCVQRCQFGALKFEVTVDKANIDMYRCFGCGVCETGCPRGAIELVDRVSIPALKEAW